MGKEWVTSNCQVVSNSCQSVLGAPELKSLQLLIDMGNVSIHSGSTSNTSDSFSLLPKPLVEKHAIQTCALDSGLSTTLHEVNPELDKLTWKFLKLFTEGVGIYTREEHVIRLKPDVIPTRSRMREAPQAYAQLAANEIE